MATPSAEGTAEHWAAVWATGAPHSWDQTDPAPSLALLTAAGLAPADAVIDVGAGDSRLVDTLLACGIHDVTVLDICESALTVTRARLGEQARAVTFVATDLLTWHPPRRYDTWHDRAVFHFLTDPADRDRYRTVLRQATHPGSRIVIGTFAPDAPDHCSGLPVARYTPDQLANELGSGFHPIAHRRHRHHTPSGSTQPFTWITARRTDIPTGQR